MKSNLKGQFSKKEEEKIEIKRLIILKKNFSYSFGKTKETSRAVVIIRVNVVLFCERT